MTRNSDSKAGFAIVERPDSSKIDDFWEASAEAKQHRGAAVNTSS